MKIFIVLLLLLVAGLLVWWISASPLHAEYQTRIREGFARVQSQKAQVVTEADLESLPVPVRKYLRYVGAVGKPRPKYFRAVFQGRMKQSETGKWLSIRSEQADFFDDASRLFFIQSTLYGIPFEGLHLFRGDAATMRIRVAKFFEIVNAHGREMNQSETVTFLNDMCLLAPASLIDTNIVWQEVDSTQVKARFTRRGIAVTATLRFDAAGALIDFISNDRYLSGDGKTYTRYPWSTPIREYKDYDGWLLASRGEAIWHKPDGLFKYAEFDFTEIKFDG